MSTTEESEGYDLAIIGAGPTGLFAAFYAGMRNLKTLVLDALEGPGGQITALYPEKYIYDVGGIPAVVGRDLVTDLFKQASQFGAHFRFSERVENLERVSPDEIRLTTPEGTYSTKTVVICAGVGAFAPNRLAVPGATELEGRGISYVVKRREEYQDRRVLVVGGGDTAMDWALDLSQRAREVTLIHRSADFKAHPQTVTAVRNANVRVLTHQQLKVVRGERWLQEVVIADTRTSGEQTLAVDDALICIGFKADIGPMQQWGLTLSGRHIVASPALETSLPGVYVAGDILSQEGVARMNLIATGFGHAALAVGQAARFITPAAAVFHGHSSQRTDMKFAPPAEGAEPAEGVKAQSTPRG